MNDIFIALESRLMTINQRISLATKSPFDKLELLVSYETVVGDVLKYSKGKAEIGLQRVKLD